MKELEFLLKPEYINNYINKKPFKFDEKIPLTVTWDEILTLVDEDFNYAIENGLEYNQGWRTPQNPWNEYGRAGYGFKILKTERIKAVEEVKNTILGIFEPRIVRENMIDDAYATIITLTTNKLLRIMPHKDGVNVFFWQILGKSEWNIYSVDDESIEYVFSLEQGDIIFCPAERTHHVKAITPRAGVSLGFSHLKTHLKNNDII